MSQLTVHDQATIERATSATREAATVADEVAARHVFSDYTDRKSANTIAAQRADLQTFSDYLGAVGIHLDAQTLQTTPAAWAHMSFGIVEGFVRWLLRGGYAIGSVNRKLSTVKVYCKLAAKAQVIPESDYRLIRTVAGYSRQEARKVDEKRQEAGRATRKGTKAAQPVRITKDQARELKRNQDDTEQAVRDDVLMCLLLDHGLRVSELCELRIENIDLDEGVFTFYRSKVNKTQTHRMTDDTASALREYFEQSLAAKSGSLLRGSRKGGKLSDAGMSRQSVSARVKELGERVGVAGLSAHDCRHYWATTAARCGTDAFSLRDAGGWNSLAMPGRYVEDSTVANERVKLEKKSATVG